MSLFCARHMVGGVTEYRSRKTGRRYVIVPDIGDKGESGFAVNALGLAVFTQTRVGAIRLIELSDLNTG